MAELRELDGVLGPTEFAQSRHAGRRWTISGYRVSANGMVAVHGHARTRGWACVCARARVIVFGAVIENKTDVGKANRKTLK